MGHFNVPERYSSATGTVPANGKPDHNYTLIHFGNFSILFQK
jgi:hypothetical protein